MSAIHYKLEITASCYIRMMDSDVVFFGKRNNLLMMPTLTPNECLVKGNLKLNFKHFCSKSMFKRFYFMWHLHKCLFSTSCIKIQTFVLRAIHFFGRNKHCSGVHFIKFRRPLQHFKRSLWAF